MTKICTQCGGVNSGHAERCSICDTRLAPDHEGVAGPSRAAPTIGNLAVAPEWRREVAHRLEAYRARRGRPQPDDSPAGLPFGRDRAVACEPAGGASFVEPAQDRDSFETPEEQCGRPTRVERVEIAISQPGLDFAQVHDSPPAARARCGAAGDKPLVPVADLDERKLAGLLDAGFVLLAYAGFLGLFASLGGQFSFGKSDAVVYAATLVLFYVQYFALFTVLSGSTPGMLLRGLRVVSFDGTAPAREQLFWRSFGYVVSGGTAMLGFLWALWDEDHLTWHDRISQTYLTPAGTQSGTQSVGTAARS